MANFGNDNKLSPTVIRVLEIDQLIEVFTLIYLEVLRLRPTPQLQHLSKKLHIL